MASWYEASTLGATSANPAVLNVTTLIPIVEPRAIPSRSRRTHMSMAFVSNSTSRKRNSTKVHVPVVASQRRSSTSSVKVAKPTIHTATSLPVADPLAGLLSRSNSYLISSPSLRLGTGEKSTVLRLIRSSVVIPTLRSSCRKVFVRRSGPVAPAGSAWGPLAVSARIRSPDEDAETPPPPVPPVLEDFSWAAIGVSAARPLGPEASCAPSATPGDAITAIAAMTAQARSARGPANVLKYLI